MLPKVGMIKTILLFNTLLFVLCLVSLIIAHLNWELVEVVQTLRGKTKYIGWPATIWSWSLLLGIASFIVILLMANQYRKRDQVSLGINSEGMYIHQQLIAGVLLPWSYVSQAQTDPSNNPLTLELTLTQEGVDHILAHTKGWRKAFVKSNLESKQLSFSNDFYEGPLEQIIQHAKAYIWYIIHSVGALMHTARILQFKRLYNETIQPISSTILVSRHQSFSSLQYSWAAFYSSQRSGPTCRYLHERHAWGTALLLLWIWHLQRRKSCCQRHGLLDRVLWW